MLVGFDSIACKLLFISVVLSLQYKKECNPMDYGAKGDGIVDDTSSIQKAMNDCYLTGNGSVYLPSSKSFLSFPLNISSVSNIGFEIKQNATLLASNNRNKWPTNNNLTIPLLTFSNVINLRIFGEGLINGQGQIWWKYPNSSRPHALVIENSLNVLITNLTMINTPNHVMVIGAKNAEISYVTVLNPPSSLNYSNTSNASHNTDAINVNGSPFWIHNCFFDTGDDNVAVHANDTLVENCYFGHGHGASIGSLHGGWYKNITFNNITFNQTTNGIRIKSWPGATQGKVSDIWYTNLLMHNVINPIIITQFYDDTDNDTIINETKSYLYFDEIYFENVTSINSLNAGYFMCQNSTPCHHINMKNVHIEASANNGDYVCLQAYGKATNVTPKPCLISD
eukprot:328871_1